MRATRSGESVLLLLDVVLTCCLIKTSTMRSLGPWPRRYMGRARKHGRGHGVVRGVTASRANESEAQSGRTQNGSESWIDQIAGLRVLDDAFTPDDPDYHPGDRAMVKIYREI
jgi:hypothetical protein